MSINTPFSGSLTFSINSDYDALIAKGRCALVDQLRSIHRCGINPNLVCTRHQHLTHILHRADTATDRQGYETLFGSTSDHIHHRFALIR